MPSVQVIVGPIRDTGDRDKYVAPEQAKRAPKLVISSDDHQLKYIFPYGPQEMSLSNIVPTYVHVERPGRLPLLLRQSPGLTMLSMTLMLGSPKAQRDMTPYIRKLERLAHTKAHVQIGHGTLTAGLWRVTGMTVNTTRLTLQNEVMQATVDMEFTRSSDASVHIGPVSGGHKKKSGKGDKDPKTAQPKRYVVRRGDTLVSIAVKHYHDASKWRRIADYNKLARPKLRVGQVLMLP